MKKVGAFINVFFGQIWWFNWWFNHSNRWSKESNHWSNESNWCSDQSNLSSNQSNQWSYQSNQWSEVSGHCYWPVSTVDEKCLVTDCCNFALQEMTD